MIKQEISEMREKVLKILVDDIRSFTSHAEDIGTTYHTLWRFLYGNEPSRHRTLQLVKRFLQNRTNDSK